MARFERLAEQGDKGRQRAMRAGDKTYWRARPCPICGQHRFYVESRGCRFCQGFNRGAAYNADKAKRYRARNREAMAMRSAGLAATPLSRILWRLLFN